MTNSLSALLLAGLALTCCASLRAAPPLRGDYPEAWWAPVDESERASWEVLPQDAAPGEVIISKRTELGAFSNLAPFGFEMDDTHYASLEGLWQGMKFPDPELPNDARNESNKWPFTRAQVLELTMFEAKHAGDKASIIMKELGVDWISYHGEKVRYKDRAQGSQRHYEIILRATRAKIDQNPELAALLNRTRGLKLRMDHDVGEENPPAYQTPAILTMIRDELP